MLSLKTCAAMLERYEAMLLAARAGDVDQLAALEGEVSSLRREAAADGTAHSASAADHALLREQIARILELDAEIRRYVEPLLDDTRKLLAGSVKDRAVRTFYGASGP